jgi:LmbE family N-acetylglucosaminyl deacetylase
MSTLAKTLITNKTHCVILSPHNDDAILSCGSLIAELVGKTDITVINIFTKAHDKAYTLSAKTFMKNSNNFSDAMALYKERVKEDKEVFAHLKIKPVDLGLEEALFRRKETKGLFGNVLPELEHVYPTYRWHITKAIAANDPAIKNLKEKLSKYTKKNTIVFAPYGIGNHADHRIVRMIAEDLFSNLILYSDFPYNARLNDYGKAFENGKTYRVAVNKKIKDLLIKGYKTQFTGLFPNGIIPKHDEVYYTKETAEKK